MKSQQQDNKIIRTSCKDCVFAKYDGMTQVDCLHDRINKFNQLPENNETFQYVTEAYDEEKEFFVINRLCTLYRDKNTWNNGNADTEKALNEVKVKFDVLIDLSKFTDEYYSYVKKLMAEAVLYDENRFNIYLYHNKSLDKEHRKKMLQLLKILPKCNLNVFFDKGILEHKILSQTKNSYHMFIDHDNRVDFDIFTKVNNLVNNDLKKLLVIKNKNNYIVSNLSYKIQTSGQIQINITECIESIIEYSKPDFYIEV